MIRVGEKGNVWVELEATGVANHAAQVHLGRNAVDALVDALGAVRALAGLAPSLPAAVERTIAEAKAVSEVESGDGEADTLRRITVNTGRIEGGIGVNTIPDRTRALCDIRIPPGVTVDRVRAAFASVVDPLPDVSWRVLACTESSRTGPRRRSSGRSARMWRRSPRGCGGESAGGVLGCPVLPARWRSECRLRGGSAVWEGLMSMRR